MLQYIDSSGLLAGERRGGDRTTPCCQSTSALGDGDPLITDTLKIPMWGKIFQGYYMCDFDSSGTSTASLQQAWEKFSKVCWLTKSTFIQPLTQALVAKLGQGSCPNCFAFHSLVRHSASSPALDELAVTSHLCIWICYKLHRHQQLRRSSSDICSPRSNYVSYDFPCGRDLSPTI